MIQKSNLTILQLTAKNVTNLRAVRITPDRRVVVLTGKNEAGKSNVLDVIQSLIEGMKLKMPIRDGEERAEAAIDLGDIKIRKRWTAKGEGLEVFRVVDGKKQKYTSPQTILNELTGKMVDPMKLFLLMKNDPRKFRAVLADMVKLDLSDLEAADIQKREERKAINDKVRDAEAQLRQLQPPDLTTPTEEMSFQVEINKLNVLVQKKQDYENYVHRVNAIKDEMKELKKVNDILQKQIAEMQDRIVTNQKKFDELNQHELIQGALPEVVTAEQISAAQEDLKLIESKNFTIREAARYRHQLSESEYYKEKSEQLTRLINRIEEDKKARIADCKFPVEGLSITDETVLFEGKPIEVASSGRQIRIFTKMAMAMSPHIKVLLIRDGSLLDSEAFEEICTIAEEAGYQIWMERVDESGKVGVFFENGEITSVDGQPVDQEEEDKEAEEEEADVSA